MSSSGEDARRQDHGVLDADVVLPSLCVVLVQIVLLEQREQ